MNIVDFQEKMDPTHRASLCRMLRTEQLPECLLTEYLKAKKMVDIIDGSLTVGELAIIALAAGYDPDTGKFEQTLKETTEGEDARLQAQADKLAVKTLVLDESDDKVIEEAVEPPFEQSVEQRPVSGVTGQATDKSNKGKAKFWSPGMPVNVLQEDELKQGKIVGVLPPADGSEKALRLTVELMDGETVTVEENEVEAV